MVGLNPDGATDVVDQDIDPTIRFEGFVHQVLRPGKRAHVHQYFGGVYAVLPQLSSGPGSTLVDALGHHDLAALLSQAPGCGAADALAGTGDHAHLVPQPLSPSGPRIQLCHRGFLPHARHAITHPTGGVLRTASCPAILAGPIAVRSTPAQP